MYGYTAEEIRSLDRHGYTLVRFLGRGNFSEVYLVRNREEELYACKVSENRELLQGEAQTMKKTEHPLFPKFAEYWQEQKGYLVMEYVAGSTLEEMICRRGGFTAERVASVGMELASGLACLHKDAGMVFRDVKPANIILCQNGKIRLIDFGCSCALGEKANSKAGSPGFSAPEQMQEGEELTAACDVYGLGKTLEAMLGKKPKNRNLRKTIAVCTEEEKERRFPDMDSVTRALANCRYSRLKIRKRIVTNRGERGYEKAILSGKMQIQKNIWKSLYKNT